MTRFLFLLLLAVHITALAGHPPALAAPITKLHERSLADIISPGNQQQVPDITLYDEAGKVVSLKAFRGKVIVLNFWATWCPPCTKEMPSLDALQADMKEMAEIGDVDKQAIEVVTISMDFQGVDAVRSFFDNKNIRHLPPYTDKGNKAFYALGIKNLPTTIIVSPRGKEIGRLEGSYDWSSQDVKDYLFQYAEHQPKE